MRSLQYQTQRQLPYYLLHWGGELLSSIAKSQGLLSIIPRHTEYLAQAEFIRLYNVYIGGS